ncbi:MAG TPA: haloacid dehalogenase type II [Rhodopila sp.]|nr:haloacid dehalogenase type II [Rhodopila sp.]
MPHRPRAVAFDIIETTFSLQSLRPRLQARGLPPAALDVWFTRILRDAFALAATGVFVPFTDIATAALHTLAAEHGLAPDANGDAAVLRGFGELEPQPDAAEAMQALKAAGIPILAVSNGAAATTRKLLDRSGLAPLVQHVISVTDIRKWKPLPDIYRHAAAVAGIAPAELALMAVHAWDVHGAKCAGLTTGFVARGQPFPNFMAAPDISAESLVEAVNGLIRLPQA